MLRLAFRNLWRRPLRLLFTLAGVSLAVAAWAGLAAFGEGYRRSLRQELDRAGMQLMLVPLGCPYDAAARVLKGNALEHSLPAAALTAVRADPAVAVAAPLLLAAVPRSAEKRTDLWVGLDESARALKPWWRAAAGADWFGATNAVILGAEAALIELRGPGDRLHSPELGTTFEVAGVLERSGTSDDSLFFLPLATAQRLLAPGRLTAVAVRLHDPAQLREASARLQQIPGAQVVTLTEMMGTFLNLVGAVRLLLVAVTLIALAAGLIGIFNTLLASVVERTPELCLLRALGASRCQVFGLVTIEALLLCGVGALAGLLLVTVGGPGLEAAVRPWIPLAPADRLLRVELQFVIQALGLALGSGLVAAVYPAWRASRLPPAWGTQTE